MGLAIAAEAFLRGAKVSLVLGPVNERPAFREIDTVNVISASEMTDQTIKHFKDCDIAVLTAAVADYTPVAVSDGKIKKENEDMNIRLKPTTDIAAKLGSMKKKNQLLVGFALETDNEKLNALSKLEKKNLDLIILNSLRDKGAGFRYDTNRVTMIDKDNNIEDFELKSKKEVAVDILDKIETILI